MIDIAISISCVIDGKSKTIVLENVNDTPIQESSTIAKHPIPSGDYVSDTMYKEPITMEVSGMFSLSGRKGIIITDEGDISLENIELLFQRIKNEGILCDLVRVKTSENNLPRFLIRRSMALQSISWTEQINTLGFRFNFQQVMQVNVNDYFPDPLDENLPDYEEPKTLNFTESGLFNKEDIMKAVNTICEQNGIVTKDFLESAAVYAVIIGVFIATLFVGTAIAIVAAAALLIYRIVKDICDASKSKVRKFKKYKNKTKNEKEVKRYADMQADIVAEFNALNEKVVVYQVAVDKAQQCILNIGDEYYCFTFIRNNIDNSYELKILDLAGNVSEYSKVVTNVKDEALASLGDCEAGTSILIISNYYVYLLNPNEDKTNDLTEYYILVSSFNMAQFDRLVDKIIKNYLLY